MKPESEFESFPTFFALEQAAQAREDHAFLIGAIVGTVGTVAIAILIIASL